MCRNYFVKNQASTFLECSKKAQKEEDEEIISSFEYTYFKKTSSSLA